VRELGRDQRTSARDALPGVVRPVLHQLFGRDVEGHGHGGAFLGSVRLRCGVIDDGLDVREHRVVLEFAVAVGVDHRDDRIDLADQVGSAGGAVLLGRVVERFERGPHGGLEVCRRVDQALERGSGGQRAAAGRRLSVAT
jgi:hypothetical protein